MVPYGQLGKMKRMQTWVRSCTTPGARVGILRNPPYSVRRHPVVHYFNLYFAVRTSDQTYCAEYETPVLDEIEDPIFCEGQGSRGFAQGQKSHAKHTEGPEAQGPFTGT